MNLFFFLNSSLSLMIFFVPFNRFVFSNIHWIDTSIKAITLLTILGFVSLRGRKALEIKNQHLYCNSYPFYKKFRLSNVAKVEVENKKVSVFLKDNSITEITYFFGIKSAIDKEVTNKFLNSYTLS